MAIRTDMDALSLDEDSEAPYRSFNKGAMHACGHFTVHRPQQRKQFKTPALREGIGRLGPFWMP
jgi:hypothetical protein